MVDLHGSTSGISKDGFDALTLEGFDEDISTLAGLVGSVAGDESLVLVDFFRGRRCDIDG